MKRIIKVLAVTVLMAILMVTLVSPAFAVIYKDCETKRDWNVHPQKGCELHGWAVGHEGHR
jgi:hypothetical protein